MRDLKRLCGCPWSGVSHGWHTWHRPVIGRLECQVSDLKVIHSGPIPTKQTCFFVCVSGWHTSLIFRHWIPGSWRQRWLLNTQDLEVSPIHAIPLMVSTTKHGGFNQFGCSTSIVVVCALASSVIFFLLGLLLKVRVSNSWFLYYLELKRVATIEDATYCWLRGICWHEL